MLQKMCYNVSVMKKPLSLKNAKRLWIAISLLWLIVIWGHSMMPATVSSGESNFVLNGLNLFIGKIGIHSQITPFMIRKAAHFTEYFILGALLSKTLRTVFCNWPLPFDSCTISMGLLVAICDEFIQHFTPGRASLVSDVMIDFSGVVSAVIIIFSLRKIVAYRRKPPVL